MSDTPLEALQAEVQRLKDIEAIEQLKARSARFVDTKEWEAWANDVLAPDYHIESDGGIQDGSEEVARFTSNALQRATTVHHCHTPEIEITGSDTATGTWAMNDLVTWPGDDTPRWLRGWGHYVEEYVRTDDGWRIQATLGRRQRVETNLDLQPRRDDTR